MEDQIAPGSALVSEEGRSDSRALFFYFSRLGTFEKGAAVGERDPDAYPQALVESIKGLSRLVLAEEDVSSTVGLIASLTVHAVDGADHCSISLVNKGAITTVATTAEVGKTIDEIQYSTGQGPCLSSIHEQEAFVIPDLSTDATWPTFSKAAADATGVRSMLSFVLKVGPDSLGAVNITSLNVDAFGDEDISAGSIFAAQAGIALANAQTHAADQEKVEQLEKGMETRQLIGQAVGILMSARQIDAEEAFEVLTQISQKTNVKLRAIAQDVVENASDL